MNVKALCNIMKLNRMLLHSTFTVRVQKDKNEPVFRQKVIKNGYNCTIMAVVLVKECCKYRKPVMGLIYCLSKIGFCTIKKKTKKQQNETPCLSLKENLTRSCAFFL